MMLSQLMCTLLHYSQAFLLTTTFSYKSMKTNAQITQKRPWYAESSTDPM